MLETVGLRQQAEAARAAARVLAGLSGGAKDAVLAEMAARLRGAVDEIVAANAADLEAGAGLSTALRDRLRLTPERVEAMARGVLDVRGLPDPVGEEEGWTRPNGLSLRRVRVPLGVVAMIYEARPNVTVESASLAFKSGNACLLRGSRSAAASNAVLVRLLRDALAACGAPADAVQAVGDMRHEAIDEMARMNGLIDCLIPRGGADLINRVVRTATVPVIETGVGNCHLYVHSEGDLEMAVRIAVNGKTQRPGVCNALESLLVDRAVAASFLPQLAAAMPSVEIRGCPATVGLLPLARPAVDADWDTEFLDLVLAVRVVEGLDEALAHIARHGSGHSEAIVTRSLAAARRFQREVDACAVYVNASTRFTDGGEFGFGAEIGISTQKLHARGPLGLRELTTVKYLVEGEGHVRP